jgi:hypothetical protein
MASIGRVEVLDNLLPEEDFKKIQEVLNSDNFYWYFKTSSLKENHIEDVDKFMFTHLLQSYVHINNSIFLNNFNIISLTLCKKYNFTEVLRMKLNLYPNQKKNVYHTKHYDIYDIAENKKPVKNIVNCIYNFTTCNGGTVIGDTTYPSIANQAIVFSNDLQHQGFSATDVQARIVLNIVFK